MLFTPSVESPRRFAPDPAAVLRSLVIPVYRNEENIPDLIAALNELDRKIDGFEVVFVVDGSPDRSAELLARALAKVRFAWQLVELSRNFGSFAAIRQGLALARGECLAVMAADLQEPPELVAQFFRELDANNCDVVVGVRASRADPLLSRLMARVYWSLYRRLIMRDIPAGGVDVFACNRAFRDALLTLEERNSFLIGQLFWLGFRRAEIAYQRRPRAAGESAWKFRRRLRYMLDSVFAFSDLPISFLLWLGAIGVGASSVLAVVMIIAWMWGVIGVRGYVPIMLAIMFFGSILILGQGILGCYLWRVSENSKKRPLSVVLSHRVGPPASCPAAAAEKQ
jgi:glycosyltransferase involved in cell wall biosynthesis